MRSVVEVVAWGRNREHRTSQRALDNLGAEYRLSHSDNWTAQNPAGPVQSLAAGVFSKNSLVKLLGKPYAHKPFQKRLFGKT